MAGEDLTVYFGEFLTSSIPLELSLNYCSHKCAVCFANLNNPTRRANIRAVMSRLHKYRDQETFQAKLLQWGYPVLISNRVDPFAASNYRQALPIMSAMTELGIPMTFQTRGGQGLDDALAFLEPSVWYISVNQLDDRLREKLEPGAPTVDSRFDLMTRLRKLGHRVIIGLNPCVPEWLPDPEPAIQRAVNSGAEGIWIDRLHLNYRQIGNMSEREKQAVGPDLIKRAQKRKPDPADYNQVVYAREIAHDLDLHVYSIAQPTESGFWSDLYGQVYDRVFPTNQDFVNACYAYNLTDTLIPWEFYRDLLVPMLPTGIWPIDSYIGAVAHNAWWGKKIPAQLSFEQVLALIWQNHQIRSCPVRIPCFAYASQWDNQAGGWIQIVDEQRMPYLTFDPEGFDAIYAHVEIDDSQGTLEPIGSAKQAQAQAS
jgi:DNA repair photolyase